MSVRDNIRAGEELSEEEIQNAVNQLEVRKKIRNLDQSISREFADDGLVLSGGESQQLMLARIIANRYPFVILDEPTSALDPLTERKINRYVMQTLASPERTILFISHRLFTTQLADRILVFDKGTIVEEGNHCCLLYTSCSVLAKPYPLRMDLLSCSVSMLVMLIDQIVVRGNSII